MPGLDLRACCTAALSALLAACVPTYYVVQSTPVAEAQVTAGESVTPRGVPDLKRLALLPWDACTSGTPAEQAACTTGLGVLEEALHARGFDVVAWRALFEQMTRHNQTSREAAQALEIPYLLRVHAPATQQGAPHLRFLRSYHASDASGTVGAVVELAARDADRLDVIAGRAEREAPFATMPVLGVEVSLERASGELVWVHRESMVERAPPPHALTLHVRCQERTCTAAERGDAESLRPARAKSERLLVPPPASLHALERLAPQLAERIQALCHSS